MAKIISSHWKGLSGAAGSWNNQSWEEHGSLLQQVELGNISHSGNLTWIIQSPEAR